MGYITFLDRTRGVACAFNLHGLMLEHQCLYRQAEQAFARYSNIIVYKYFIVTSFPVSWGIVISWITLFHWYNSVALIAHGHSFGPQSTVNKEIQGLLTADSYQIVSIFDYEDAGYFSFYSSFHSLPFPIPREKDKGVNVITRDTFLSLLTSVNKH